ncbi:hypothetical protein [Xanthovirga aplysinae]|uniref:hypothetical protein n=1 Tax=Xanthovirga aplysinae TaxID=2529853 RepID=UPI0012BBD74B|nr:hypothetical protein [Xanthovirga aplysinae]MTI29647.1 hypothetical protein [Xanthovirga aplysinae]
MKRFISIITLLVISCSDIKRKDLVSELNGNSFKWKIHLEDSVIAQSDIHFFRDSLYVYVFEDEKESHAQFGFWNVKQDFKSQYLSLKDILNEATFTVNSWKNDTLTLSYDSYTYTVTKLHNKKINLSEKIVGSWIAPLDSFPRTLPEFEETGKFLMNPTFSFSKDSFNIRTEGFRRTGKFNVFNGETQFIVLETESGYDQNKFLIFEEINKENLVVRFKNDRGWWKPYKLIKKNGAQH